MNQFFVDSSSINDGKIIITGKDVKHIEGVLRLKSGEMVQVVNSDDGITYTCSIEKLDKNAVCCLIEDMQSDTTELPAEIVLFQGLPKGDKFEFVIQKAVEMGAAEIVPVSMKRSVMKIDPKKKENKLVRWNSIAASAASQSKRRFVPAVSEVMSFKEAIDKAKDFDLVLLPYELAEGMEGTRQIMDALKKRVFDDADMGKKTSVGIFIGPEGGFEETEIEMAKSIGANVITLGRRILRTETAPIAILSWLTYLLDQ